MKITLFHRNILRLVLLYQVTECVINMRGISFCSIHYTELNYINSPITGLHMQQTFCYFVEMDDSQTELYYNIHHQTIFKILQLKQIVFE